MQQPPLQPVDEYNHVHDMAPTSEAGDEPNIRELNDALRVLVDLFPDVQPDVFREMLVRVSPSSRVEIVAEQLLKHDAEYIQGRYRRGLVHASSPRRKRPKTAESASRERSSDDDTPRLRVEEMFRSQAYKQTVKRALYDEFKSLSHATIKAVLAENNYHYTPSRGALLDIASKSWRASIADFFFRRKTPSSSTNPFVSWTASKHSSQKFPNLMSSGNAELDEELNRTLVLPALQREREAQNIIDHAFAHQLAEQEAQEALEEYDCEVCYTTVSVNKLGVCDDGGHFICFTCISRTITEALYGQGWSRSVSDSRGTMKCVAPILDGSGECNGCIPFALVRLALADREVRGESTLQKFEERLVSSALQNVSAIMVRCPFCPYAEVDDLDLCRSLSVRWRDPREVKVLGFSLLLFLVSMDRFALWLPLLPLLYVSLANALPGSYNPLRPTLLRLARKSRGLRFTCRSPECGKRSCLRCHALWRNPHACYSTQLTTLQKSIEAAQTEAIKRVCPKCNLSFVKSSGCNKLVCPCGYSMCYLCRGEIIKGGINGGYDHFCQHFRMNGGRCTQCDKCDLYREEDEREVLKLAREKAEKAWREGEGKDITIPMPEVAKLVEIRPGWRQILDPRCWQMWLDRLVEHFVIVTVE
ncbi:uncharacterized protein PV09_03271 [Verruconis gallopava]|uniref:RING-type domain-containing protein n=1 Tax=Verruconis gallopava TaxID=253628 RepID=A0A0D2AGQ9_9PEZI|nr:uncharacterized protein PV09_03271 [Verruconis gallopava]KIW06103.1 hypothetical protein PV09_03271 [Verruconis gallopava]